ncbi:J domain-containing protein [Luteolibacter yonseiensis]|uniref:J domain-containing protein n=1 Tax=Luteolibacter yonseiensis TaxID=1144680 RepID=A0A934R7A6_9BACT|nr:J domain-containing protein [Luteolibacter yonseiensis]MBK1817516.1 J domain-containing protein [Luteolibacter yonseiensis]
MENIDAFPLSWPEGWPRHRGTRERGSFTGTPRNVQDELLAEIDRLALGASSRTYTVREKVIISTNVPLRRDGFPMANRTEPSDPGVAVYFERKGKKVCFACDKYDRVWKNMRAIQKTIDALRGIERWGSSDMLDRAFTGFAALPAPERKPWWVVLGCEKDSTYAHIRDCYKMAAKRCHPDNGGSHERMAEINAAYEEATR